MKIQHVLILNVFSILRTLSKIYRPQFLDLETCESEQTGSASLTNDINIMQKNTKSNVGATLNLNFLAVIYTGESIGKSDICTKPSGANTNLNIIGDKVKMVLYKSSDKIKIVFVGAITDEVFKPYMIEQIEKDKKFVYVESVKCIAEGEVADYKAKATEPKPFVSGSSYLCFVRDLISKDVTVISMKGANKFEFVVSKYSQQPCPKCPDLLKPTDCKPS